MPMRPASLNAAIAGAAKGDGKGGENYAANAANHLLGTKAPAADDAQAAKGKGKRKK